MEIPQSFEDLRLFFLVAPSFPVLSSFLFWRKSGVFERRHAHLLMVPHPDIWTQRVNPHFFS